MGADGANQSSGERSAGATAKCATGQQTEMDRLSQVDAEFDSRLGTVLFGDRIGYAIFLGTICVAMLAWRADVFITDNETLVATLEALRDGRFYVEEVEGEAWFNAPGSEVRDGRVYGRNYGQLIASLPALLALQVVDAVANVRVALIALWHLTALAFLAQIGRLLNQRLLVGVGGGLVVLALFVLNLGLATELVTVRLELLALQLTSTLAAGFVGVFCYRLVAPEDRTMGILFGVASVIVLPIGIWATIPKRHVFTTLVVVLVLYLFARSRDPSATTELPVLGSVPLHRAGAYAAVGFLTWIHAAEGLFVFLPLLVLDLLTAPANDRRTLAFVGGVFFVSLLPTMVTNLIVAGTPFEPPRLMSGESPVGPAAEAGDDGASSLGDVGIVSWLEDLVVIGALFAIGATVLEVVTDSLAAARDPERLFHVFVRSAGGDVTGGRDFAGAPEFQATNLSVLESAPILAGAVVAAGAWLWQSTNRPRQRLRETNPTVLLSLALTGSFLLLYLSRLPLYVQVTQRYVLPVYVLLLSVLVSSRPARRLVRNARPTLTWTYAIGVLVGCQLFLTVLVIQDYSAGEAAQAQARLSLATASLVIVSVALFVVTDRYQRLAAVACGLAAATGTVLFFVATLALFPGVAEYVLPVVEWVARRV